MADETYGDAIDRLVGSDRVAPAGTIWVCSACGKTAEDQYGNGAHTPGWDVSCMLSAVLCEKESLVRDPDTGRVTKAMPFNPIGKERT